MNHKQKILSASPTPLIARAASPLFLFFGHLFCLLRPSLTECASDTGNFQVFHSRKLLN